MLRMGRVGVGSGQVGVGSGRDQVRSGRVGLGRCWCWSPSQLTVTRGSMGDTRVLPVIASVLVKADFEVASTLGLTGPCTDSSMNKKGESNLYQLKLTNKAD